MTLSQFSNGKKTTKRKIYDCGEKCIAVIVILVNVFPMSISRKYARANAEFGFEKKKKEKNVGWKR